MKDNNRIISKEEGAQVKKCHQCQKHYVREGYSNINWNKNENARKCKQCVDI